MIRIAVCDDEHCFVAQIHTILTSQAKSLPCAIHISTYLSSSQLLYDVEEGRHFDLLFLDIEMPENNGMNLASAIGKLLPLALTVFVTSHTKYAVIVLEHEKILHRKSLDQVLGELCAPKREGGFLMVERGYIVNLFHVEKMEGSELFLDNGAVIPVSRRNQKEVRNTITSYWRKKL